MKNRRYYLPITIGVVIWLLSGWVFIQQNNQAVDAAIQLPNLAADEVYVPAGPFGMGCAADQTTFHCDGDAQPIHLVYLDAFYIDRLEVTNAQYATCEAAGVCPHPLTNASATRANYYNNPVYNQYPVLNITWDYANAYCRWVSKRLPSEAEWEKAARGTDLRPFPWGHEEPTCERSNIALIFPNEGDVLPRPCVGDTVAVGSYPQNASPYGVLDLVGNVREFVNDFYQSSYYAKSPYYNPQGPATNLGKDYIARGGGWYDHSRLATNWVRHDEASALLYEHIGFRCARNAPIAPTPTPTPSPTPTPLPSDSGGIGPEGGLLWMTHPNHLTALHIPAGHLTSEMTVTITYTQPRPLGELHGMDHFFTVSGAQLTEPAALLLGFKNSGGIVADTAALYRLDASAWVTSNITITEKSTGHLLAWITQPGTYGILGRTNRVYLPLIIRR